MKFADVLCAVALFAATPSLAQEREWTFDTGDEEAFLVFGVAESDDAGISFWCKMKSGEVHIFLAEAGEHLPLKKKARLQIIVARKTFAYEALVSVNGDAGSMSAEATARADAPLFAALRDAESFIVKVAHGERTAFPLPGADIDSLTRVCAKS